MSTRLGPTTSIILRPEEFAKDEETRLGRANGNTYQRKPGVENVHDGQIMVRLKKKRFIILDYGYVPNEHDHQIAKGVPHIIIPSGAGRMKCATKDCPRVGVPVMLYDSNPNEPVSLYLRGGLCFSCQRNLNEKRRTNKKRKPEEEHPELDAHSVDGNESKEHPALSRFKVNGDFIELNPDAIIINGPIDGTRMRGPGYQCAEIGSDVLLIVSELTQEANSLMSYSSESRPVTAEAVASTSTINALYEKTFLSLSKATYLLTQWKASWDEALANNIAAATAAEAAVNAALDSRALDDAVAATAAALASATQEGAMNGNANNADSVLMPAEPEVDDAPVEV